MQIDKYTFMEVTKSLLKCTLSDYTNRTVFRKCMNEIRIIISKIIEKFCQVFFCKIMTFTNLQDALCSEDVYVLYMILYYSQLMIIGSYLYILIKHSFSVVLSRIIIYVYIYIWVSQRLIYSNRTIIVHMHKVEVFQPLSLLIIIYISAIFGKIL